MEIQKANRPCVMGVTHTVAAGHYMSAQAGLQMLEAGGNAIDAGVAAGIALGVLQTDRVNFAGVAPIMIYLAKERKVVNIDGLFTGLTASGTGISGTITGMDAGGKFVTLSANATATGAITATFTYTGFVLVHISDPFVQGAIT